MKNIAFILLFLSTLAFSQQEASVWYFGGNAGLKFQTDGTVIPLSDGQLVTEEGCSSIADSNGNLLFYTDGRTVWDRNHVVMPNGSFANGTELFGDDSSTQSAIIVPKPDDPSIYYIFTVDEPHNENAAVYPATFSGDYDEGGTTPLDDDGRNNGFNYSIVDLSVMGSNGSIGDIVSRNNHLVTYNTLPSGQEIKYKCSEKVTAVKNEQDNSYWVITHFINRFYSFKVTASGVMTTPVVSTLGSEQVLDGYRRNAIGYLKASPNGEKLAIAHRQNGSVPGEADPFSGSLEVFDFDVVTGLVSNPIRLLTNGEQAYGVEFSPNSELLYATYRFGNVVNSRLVQFDLTSATIPNTLVELYDSGSSYLFALQLAPNNKIYCATGYVESLGVINNPNTAGMGCNYVQVGQPLATGKKVKLGLPPFITSFFNASFIATNLCLGSTTQFTLTGTSSITSASWDFGDGSPVINGINPTHQYAMVGDYIVTATVTSTTGTVTKQKTITISSIPIFATTITNSSICGTEGMVYDLAQYNDDLIGTQTNVGVAYFATLADATNHINLLPTNYPLVSDMNTFFAKVYTLNNLSCSAITSFSVTLSITPIANIVNNIFVCDDASNDGVAVFDFNPAVTSVLGSQAATQFNVSFHVSQNDADTDVNALPLLYQNISNPQTIYVRIENRLNASCFSTVSFQIGLFQLPIAHQPQDMETCDGDENDGFETFDLSQQNNVILGTQSSTDFTVTYHSSQEDAEDNVNPLSTSFINTVNPQTIYVRLENNLSQNCYSTTSFELIVHPKPVLDLSTIYSICEGNSIFIAAPLGFDSYEWSNGLFTNPVEITEAGDYTLTVTKNYGSIVCETTKSFVVYNSNIATITNILVSDWTDTENSIEIIAEGDGDYEYSIDGIHYQDSSIFTSLSSGTYTVYVNDKKGCGFVSEVVYVLMYPKFFTPNGDGYNDVWKVKFSNIEPDMELQLFDRYGKLLTAFIGTSIGWDGTLNGYKLPADDYWFVIKRADGKDYKGHFALKR